MEDIAFEKIGRNDPCPCKSGRKYKYCHLAEIEAAKAANAVGDYAARKKLILSAGDLPVYKCIIGKDWKEHGLARVAVARTQPNGRLVYGMFLVDVFCLGAKNSFCNAEMSVEEFENIFIPMQLYDTKPESITLEFAKALIYGAVAYARDLGFEPDADFDLASRVLGDDKFKPDKKIKFGGPNGKPLYVVGPNDNSRLIISKLEHKLGEDGFEIFDPRD